jgi:hypothetical protein
MRIVIVYVFGLRPLYLISGDVMCIAYLLEVLFSLLLYLHVVFENEFNVFFYGLFLVLLHRRGQLPVQGGPSGAAAHVEELAAAERLRLETGEDQSPLPVEVLSELRQVPYRELQVQDSYDGRLIQLAFLIIGDSQIADTLDVLLGGEPAVEPEDGADREK